MKRIISILISICLLFNVSITVLASDAGMTSEETDATISEEDEPQQEGQVRLFLTDEFETPIHGARFGVYNHDDTLLEEISTTEDGSSIFGNYELGDGYYLKQLSGIAGYRLDTETRYEFAVHESDIISIHVINPRIYGKIRISKTDDVETPLSGVVFGVYRNNELIAELITGEDGVVESDLLYYGSDYELRELSTLDGYVPLVNPIPIAILNHEETIEISIKNTRILGSVTVRKTDAGNEGILLEGAILGIYDVDGQKIAEFSTDATGLGSVSELPIADYFIKELVAPKGYILKDNLIPFSITALGEHVDVTIENERGFGYIKIIKTNTEQEPLFGTVFEIYNASNHTMVAKIASDTDGTALKELPLGDYYIVETAASDGYQISTERVPFTLTDHGQVFEVPIQNQKVENTDTSPLSGKLVLIKKSEKGEKLAGAVYGVFHALTDEKIGEITSDQNGEASILLPEGNFYLRELQAPEGYVLVTDRYIFTIQPDQIKEMTLTNTPVSPPTPDPIEPTDTNNPDKNNKTDESSTASIASGNEITINNNIDYSPSQSITKPENANQTGENKTPQEPTPSSSGNGVTINNNTDSVPTNNTTANSNDSNSSNSEKNADPSSTPTTSAEKEIIINNNINNSPVQNINKSDETVDPTETKPEESAAVPDHTGTLRLIKKAEGSGKGLTGSVFGVYDLLTGKLKEEITTGDDGIVNISLSAGSYFLSEHKASDGYLLDTVNIPFAIAEEKTVEVEITNMIDTNKLDSDAKNDSKSSISIPETGEAFPTIRYILATLFSGLTIGCAFFLIRNFKKKRVTEKR